MSIESQEQLKRQLLAWMKKYNVSVEALAARCDVAESTAKKWLSTTPIPGDKQILLRAILNEVERDRAARRAMRSQWQPVTITLARKDYERLCVIAKAKRTTPDTLIEETLADFIEHEWNALFAAPKKPENADVTYAEETEEEIRLAAEDPEEYTP